MRPGFIIAAVVAIAVVIGGLLWYNNTAEQARLEEQRVQQVEMERQQELAREEALAAEQRAAEEAEIAAAEEQAAADAAVTEEAPVDGDAGLATDDAIVVGDEITEDTIVVESATQEPVILDADDAATTVEIAGADEPAAPAAAPTTGTAPEADTGLAGPTDVEPEAEELLTPENFEGEAVITLIENAPQLTPEQRSTLTALTEGAVANPAMVDSAIEAVRTALGLPPL